MGTYFIFTIKAAVCLIAFYLFYKLLLSKETFHRFNRMALLGMVILSMIIPAIKMTIANATTVNRGFITMEGILQPQIVKGDMEPSLTITQYLFIFYMAGVILFVIREIVSVVKLRILLGKGERKTINDGIQVVILDEDIAPFSWFRHIVISRDDYDHHREEIFTHELAHISLHHSMDIAFCNLLIVVQWFNPVSWLLKRELQNIHEFEADEKVISQGVNAQQYQMLLIRKSVGERLFSMANCLNHNSLKKRITMMTIKKSNPWSRLKYLYVIPVAAVAVVSFASPKAEQVSNQIERESDAVASRMITPAQQLARSVVPVATPVTKNSAVVDSPSMKVFPPSADVKTEAESSAAPQVKDTANVEDKVFDVTEKLPDFKGGKIEMFKFIANHIRYPKNAQKKGIQGRVIVTFVVTKTGKITNANIAHSVDPELDAEALRVVNSMPDWTPAYQNNEAVNAKYTVPITFRLNGKDDKGTNTHSGSLTVIGYAGS